ncbi:MAG: hypothetical protein FWF29_02260 [Treponema sp.]|nr:hypothetical protein [Treponema sp.]
MIFTDTVTVYNCYSESLPPFPPKVKYSRTVIRNVMWKDNVHVNTDSGGKNFIGQTVSVTIPLEAVTDKKYIRPADYAIVHKDKFWTLNIDKANPDVIVFGECTAEITDTYTISNLKKDCKTADVQAVSDSTDQGILPMWKIEGV